MKMSGIGCSSKSPAYFMSRSHSFNWCTVVCPRLSTGAHLANHTNMLLGVSGDGDTASIGMGQFVHLMRRNLPMIYIIEDNGVYGLTKGQFSATADIGSKLKTGVINDLPAIDTCALAIQLGATFVGRSFSGDKKQLLAMLKAAICPQGNGDARRDQSLRDVQRSRGVNEKLQVHAGKRRAHQRCWLCCQLRRHRCGLRFRSGVRSRDARWIEPCACASSTRTTIPQTRPTR